jgi:hypothetical protein
MNKNLKYGLIAFGGLVVILAISKYNREKVEPTINKDMEDLIKRIDEAKK